MDISRIVSAACVVLLTLCFLLSICTVTVLRKAVIQSTDACFEMQSYIENLDAAPKAESLPVQDTEADSSVPVDVLADRFCIRESNGRVAIYTDDGYLIRLLEISVETLPAADRLALQQGIYRSSWKEVLDLMEDFGT